VEGTFTVRVNVSQVSEVQAAVVAVAPVKGPPLNEMEVVCPAAGAVRVPLEGVAAKADDMASIRATNVSPKTLRLFILISSRDEVDNNREGGTKISVVILLATNSRELRWQSYQP
jgi:hypothetical protein